MTQTNQPQTPAFPPQHQENQPGIEFLMNPRPVFENPADRAGGKLSNKAAVITGGDSGIGRAAAVAFAKEGADVAIVYLNEHEDAQETKALVERQGRRCLLIPGDIGKESFCQEIVSHVMQAFGKIDILVNNAAEQHPQNSILDITDDQLQRTFRTNFFGYFYLTKAALPHLKAGSSIINTASITAHKGDELLIDYSASKGAVVSFTRSLSESLVKLGIRVNAISPGPVWTPLIPASFQADQVSVFGTDAPMKRAAQPHELAPVYVFLASEDSSYVSGQILHVNGGNVISC